MTSEPTAPPHRDRLELSVHHDEPELSVHHDEPEQPELSVHHDPDPPGLSPALLPMLLLTFGTGVLDAATYLGLHGVFTANMTGNVIFVGLGLAREDTTVLLRSVLALAGFLVGAAVVGRVSRGRPSTGGADPVVAWSLAAVTLVVGSVAVLLAVTDPSSSTLDAVTAVTAAAMGAQAAAARRVGVRDVATVAVTAAVTGLAADHRWSARTHDRRVLLERVGAVASLLVGALVGALLLRWDVAAAVALSAVVLAVVTGGAVVVCRRRGRAQQHQQHQQHQRHQDAG